MTNYKIITLQGGQSVFEFTGKIGYPDIAEFVLRNNTPDQTVYVSVGYELIPDYPINSEYFYEV